MQPGRIKLVYKPANKFEIQIKLNAAVSLIYVFVSSTFPQRYSVRMCVVNKCGFRVSGARKCRDKFSASYYQ